MLTFLRKKGRSIMIIVAVLFLGSMFYGLSFSRLPGGSGGLEKRIAKVNGSEVDPMRFQEMTNRLLQQFKGKQLQPSDLAFIQNMALSQTVDFMLVLAEAKKRVRVANVEVEGAINGLMQQQKLNSKQELEAALKRIGTNLGRFKNLIKDEILVQKMVTKVRSEVTVTPDDLREVRASHILVSQEARARELLTRIKKGEDFGQLAKEYSLDTGSAVKSGDLGFFATGAMVDTFEKAAFKLKAGEVSDIVKTSFGYHLIKVYDSRLHKFAGAEKEFDRAALMDKQVKSFNKWFGELRAKAKVEVFTPILQGHDFRFKGRVYEAIQAYKKAIAQEPNNPMLHVFLGDTFSMMGKNDLALPEYEAAASLGGGDPTYSLLLAKTYERLGQTAKAITIYEQVSLVAGDNKAMHEDLLKKFRELKAGRQASHEQAELAAIAKREKFEKELKGQ
ncbi:peptidylprolyl isomerase [Candidatus Saganbacteria bacterium]|nr:peptidylprolyl isomerase [Candidatus Saganbacteria bacterium]